MIPARLRPTLVGRELRARPREEVVQGGGDQRGQTVLAARMPDSGALGWAVRARSRAGGAHKADVVSCSGHGSRWHTNAVRVQLHPKVGFRGGAAATAREGAAPGPVCFRLQPQGVGGEQTGGHDGGRCSQPHHLHPGACVCVLLPLLLLLLLLLPCVPRPSSSTRGLECCACPCVLPRAARSPQPPRTHTHTQNLYEKLPKTGGCWQGRMRVRACAHARTCACLSRPVMQRARVHACMHACTSHGHACRHQAPPLHHSNALHTHASPHPTHHHPPSAHNPRAHRVEEVHVRGVQPVWKDPGRGVPEDAAPARPGLGGV